VITFRKLSFSLYIVACLLGACSQVRDPGDDAGTATIDAGDQNDRDAEPTADSSAPTDRDDDGVVDAMDCDPNDAAVSETASRPCTSTCGEGVEQCTSGTWAACSAPVDCLCNSPGATRAVPCGNCGMQSERCQDGRWTEASGCLDQGPCSPGQVEDRQLPTCGHDQRICNASCEWGDWNVIRPNGECSRGFTTCGIPFEEPMLCTDECVFVPDPCCPRTPECMD
jgi:hypothetical protein